MSDAKPPIAVLDNRAATYAKLHRLKAALRDGKQMIEQEKCNCIGYLRTGKILQLMDNSSTALNIYQLGLRRVPPSEPNIKLLQGLRDKLAKQCAPPKAVDPLQTLPIEIVEYIISYMEFKQTVNMLRVSKSWQALLSSMPKVWTNLDFSTTKRNATLTAARQYVKNARGTCSAVRFSQFSQYQQNILSYVASRCKGLREVKLLSGFVGISFLKAAPCAVNLKTLIISSQCEITADAVTQLLDQCMNLERAEFHQVKAHGSDICTNVLAKLHTLVLNVVTRERDLPGLDKLLANVENVRSLTLRNWDLKSNPLGFVDFSIVRNLEYLDLSHVRSISRVCLPTSVCSLNMTGCILPYTQQAPVLPNLLSLSIGSSISISMLMLRDILATNEVKLRTLDICAAPFTPGDITALISVGYLAGIEELKIRNTFHDDEVAILLAHNLPNLRFLDLGRTRVTGVGVKALITELKGKLEWLGLDECMHTSIDAVKLARSMGVKVSYRFPDPKGSKKVGTHF